jgi:hypothetical protein
MPAIASSHELVPAWDAVFGAQQRRASGYWLIAQPDHAALAGDLAEQFARAPYPRLDADMVRAIRLHDAGWAPLDGGGECGVGTAGGLPMPEPRRLPDGRPKSFLDFAPQDFLPAWSGSIAQAEQASGDLGGLLVSEHFARLARTRLDAGRDSQEDTRRLREFLEAQEREQYLWMSRVRGRFTRERMNLLADALQFCDLLSLYLCCGAEQDVGFPQVFEVKRPALHRRGALCELDPSPFTREISVRVQGTLDGSREQQSFEFQLR